MAMPASTRADCTGPAGAKAKPAMTSHRDHTIKPRPPIICAER